MISSGIVEIDLHGCRVDEAQKKVEAAIRSAHPSVYRIRVIHGYHGGTAIASMIRREFGYGLEPKVLRIVAGTNQGITELVLREYS